MEILDMNSVRQERRALHVTLATLSRMTGIGAGALSLFERKLARLPSAKARRVQSALYLCQTVAAQAEPPFDWPALALKVRSAVDEIERRAAPPRSS